MRSSVQICACKAFYKRTVTGEGREGVMGVVGGCVGGWE